MNSYGRLIDKSVKELVKYLGKGDIDFSGYKILNYKWLHCGHFWAYFQNVLTRI